MRARTIADVGRHGPTTDQLWTLLAWLLPVIAVVVSRMPTEDLAYQITAGKIMIDAGHVLRTDPFTFTMGGQPWLDQQWGAQIVLSVAFRAAGWQGLVLLRALIVSVAFGVMFARSQRMSGDALVASILTLSALVITFVMPGTVALRPQLLAVPLFLLTTGILRRRDRGDRVLLWLPFITVLWANLHGSFVLVFLLCGIALAGDLARRRSVRWLSVAMLTCVVAAAANPWGFRVYGYVADLATATIVRTVIDEWQPLWRLSPAGPVVLAAIAVVAVMFATGRLRRPVLEDALGLTAFGALAVASGRNLLWACLYIPPVIAGLMPVQRERISGRSKTGIAVVGVLASLLALGIGRVATADPATSLLSQAPSGITEALERATSPGTRVFDGWWASWLEFSLPGVPMFVDARAELFPDRVWDDFFTISRATDGWRSALDRWAIDVVVASYDHQEGLIPALAREPGWVEVYRDRDGVIFQRAGGEMTAIHAFSS